MAMVPISTRAWIACGLLVAGFLVAWNWQGSRYEARLSDLRSANSQALAEAQERARRIEQGWHAAIDEVRKDAAEQQESISADRATTDRDVDGVREATDKRTNSAARDTPAECRSASATSALILYSELLDRGAERIAALAEEADRRRVAGLACEAAYEALRGNKKAGD